MPVHLYGYPADLEPILDYCHRHNLWVIEDAAQAAGASVDGRRAGSLGTAATFSFFPSKNLGCFGDGGAIATSKAVDHVLVAASADPRVVKEMQVTAYHVLWELVHVFFEQPGVLGPGVIS